MAPAGFSEAGAGRQAGRALDGVTKVGSLFRQLLQPGLCLSRRCLRGRRPPRRLLAARPESGLSVGQPAGTQAKEVMRHRAEVVRSSAAHQLSPAPAPTPASSLLARLQQRLLRARQALLQRFGEAPLLRQLVSDGAQLPGTLPQRQQLAPQPLQLLGLGGLQPRRRLCSLLCKGAHAQLLLSHHLAQLAHQPLCLAPRALAVLQRGTQAHAVRRKHLQVLTQRCRLAGGLL